MKRYWDTSALVNALHDLKIRDRLFQPDQWTRPHTFCEAFSTLTGGRLGFRYSPDDAAELLNDVASKMSSVELSAKDTALALASAQKLGVRGGRIHDLMHARAAAKAKVAVLVTDNAADFVGLENNFRVIRSSDL